MPLLVGNAITLTDGSQDETPSAALNLDTDCAKVNVPIGNLFAEGYDYAYTVQDGNVRTFQLDKLYNAAAVPDTSDAENAWKYEFVTVDPTYHVFDSSMNEITTPVTPTVTTVYYVGYWVTPKSGSVALVGDVAGKTLARDAVVIAVKSMGVDELNGNTVEYQKSLVYDEENNQYILSFQASVSVDVPDPSLVQEEYTTSGTYTVPQAWILLYPGLGQRWR